MQSFSMHLNLSCYQLKIDYYKYVLCTPQGKHKAKTIVDTQKIKKNGIQAYHYRKSSNHKGREQEKKKETKEL